MNQNPLSPSPGDASNRRQLDLRLAKAEAALRRIPARPARQSNIAPLYLVVGGNILPSGQTVGLARRTDAVAASELPAGVGGSAGDILVQAAYPFPAGLPLGVGVGQHPFTLDYVFLLLDNHTTYASDLPLGRRAFTGTVINLDKVVASVTYRYVCQLVVAGY